MVHCEAGRPRKRELGEWVKLVDLVVLVDIVELVVLIPGSCSGHNASRRQLIPLGWFAHIS